MVRSGPKDEADKVRLKSEYEGDSAEETGGNKQATDPDDTTLVVWVCVFLLPITFHAIRGQSLELCFCLVDVSGDRAMNSLAYQRTADPHCQSCSLRSTDVCGFHSL
jgi:hypothetical protein